MEGDSVWYGIERSKKIWTWFLWSWCLPLIGIRFLPSLVPKLRKPQERKHSTTLQEEGQSEEKRTGQWWTKILNGGTSKEYSFYLKNRNIANAKWYRRFFSSNHVFFYEITLIPIKFLYSFVWLCTLHPAGQSSNPLGGGFVGWRRRNLFARWKKNPLVFPTPKHGSKASPVSRELRCRCVWVGQRFEGFLDLREKVFF